MKRQDAPESFADAASGKKSTGTFWSRSREPKAERRNSKNQVMGTFRPDAEKSAFTWMEIYRVTQISRYGN
ncbi:MAG: hypothetical protein EOP06_30130 [Proteobacteria bacterium]|nr:MAG: hypothetical protein EOP06_30130 [Pseudomonadota bacterium]